MGNFSIKSEIQDDSAILTLSSRLDAETCVILEDKYKSLKDQGIRKFKLDFTLVDYISSAGLRVLIQQSKDCGGNSHYQICNPCDSVKEIITSTGLHKVLTLIDSIPNFNNTSDNRASKVL